VTSQPVESEMQLQSSLFDEKTDHMTTELFLNFDQNSTNLSR
jgi:hypothetical protein